MQQMVIQSGQEDNHQTSNLIPSAARGQEQLTSSDMVSLLLDDDELVTRCVYITVCLYVSPLSLNTRAYVCD